MNAVYILLARRCSAEAALGLTRGGIAGVLCAAFIVRSLSIEWLRWLVVVVVIYAAVLMLMSVRVPAGSQTSTPGRADPLQSHDA
jgi:uncharacterized membrane protein YfcA